MTKKVPASQHAKSRSMARTSFPRAVGCVVAILITAAVVAGAAGCGGGSGGSTATTSTLSPAEVENATGTISVVGWQFYQEPKAESVGSVKANWTYLGTEKDIYTKARTGEFNVINSGASVMGPLTKLGAVQPIDTAAIPGFDKIDKTVRTDPIWESEGNVYGVPVAVSPSFTAWDSSEVPEPKTLDDLLDPVYRDSIGLVSDPTVIEQIATAQGVKDTRELTKQQLDEVMEYLEELRPNIKTFFQFGEEAQLFNRGEVKVLLQGAGSYLSKAIETNPSIRFNFLAENSLVDSWSLGSSDNEAASLNWIGQTLSKEGQEGIVKASEAFPVNEEALGALSALDNPVAAATAERSLSQILRECPISHGFSAESHGDVVGLDEVVRAWTGFQASF